MDKLTSFVNEGDCMTTSEIDKSSPRVIAVSSGKGGVGKTFFSIHLAARAVKQGLRVL